jgi:hypothetical protein
MNIETILEQIDAEIAKLQQVKALLNGTGVQRGSGRPGASLVVSRILSVEPIRHHMSAEGKARIAAAQKARWAAQKRADKKTVKVTKPAGKK